MRRQFFKNFSRRLILILLSASCAGNSWAQQASPGTGSSTSSTNQAPAPAANPAPPPSEPAKRSADDLQKLVAPIALYPDPLIATILPASAYPLEIVQAARFVKDTNNIAKLDEQSWDDNVKAVARLPDVITQMDQNISWTSDLGDAFINQPKELMDAIQTMRTKAQNSGALKTTEQQVVTVTNTIVTNVVQQQTVVVTNQVVQIQPAQPEVIYVPQYNPTVVYAGYPVTYPGYYYPPYYPGTVAAASIISFGAGMAMGAWIANGCDWGHGGCWNSHNDINIHNDINVNRNFNGNRNVNVNNRQKWQPDQNRLRNSGSTLSSTQNREARGWNSGQGANRSSTGNVGSRPNTGTAGNRPSTGVAGNRPQTGTVGNNRPSTANTSTRPSTGVGGTRSTSGGGGLTPTGNRSGGNSGNLQSRQSSGGGSAFSSGNASAARSSSMRGASSRGGGGFSGGGGGFRSGGGGRGGGGRR